jgi:hypothetical protein
MRWIDNLSKAQRVVVVIVLGGCTRRHGQLPDQPGDEVRLVRYSPLTRQQYQPPGNGLPGWLRLIIWLAAIGLWAFASVTVLRHPRTSRA